MYTAVNKTALITGASSGIGRACAQLFCCRGINVIGVDRSAVEATDSSRYTHYVYDITDEANMPDFPQNIDYIICSAGTQCENDIQVNLTSTIHFIESLTSADRLPVKSVINIASTSAHNGAEFPEYAASKGGLLAYTKNLAMRLGQRGYGAPMIESLLEDMDEIVDQSHLVTAEEWAKRSVLRRVFEPLLRLFAIWM